MLYYMLIILIEKQLDICLVYLIYNSFRPTRFNFSKIFKLTKDVRRIFYAHRPKSFRLTFQTGPQYGPAWLFYSTLSLSAHRYPIYSSDYPPLC